ncbi:hypothetical protein TVD_13375 [Thioalkalivibrio versutus]|uniref:Uncharacterized protein n=1 Tax=Thioalkalivibrio versutus TaxID=106634 RepID=A0A0G3GAB3_9GAMM|nr:hypothetical protein TVD_13375 [Thioalkalivibrio versutus]
MLLAFATCLLLGLALPAIASDNPFAEEHVVLQISDNDPSKQTLILNVANNLLNHYGPDRVAVEVVAFGPGLRLLFENNTNQDRIQALVDQGVRFSACANTLTGMGRIIGHPPDLNPHAQIVDAGVVRIMELQQQDYSLIKP